MPSPAAAGVPAATVFAYPDGSTPAGRTALLALPMVLVPALLMVSTIRFRSFKTIDLRYAALVSRPAADGAGHRRDRHAPADHAGRDRLHLPGVGLIGVGVGPAAVRRGAPTPAPRWPTTPPVGPRADPPDTIARSRSTRRPAPGRVTRPVGVQAAARSSPSSRRRASLATAIVPPFSSTLRRAMVRPRPVPVALVEKYGSKMRRQRLGVHADAGVGDAPAPRRRPSRRARAPSACRRRASRAARSR